MVIDPISVIDFEGSPRSGVLEYGVVVLKNGQIDTCYSRLCAARGRIGRDEWAVHKISSNDLNAAKPFKEEWALFSGLRLIGPLCAHNACVENGFLRAEWPYPRVSPDFSISSQSPDASVADWGPCLDTLPMYKKYYPGLDSYNLEQLINNFHLGELLKQLGQRYCPPGRNHYHCALFDALASTILLQKILRELNSDQCSVRYLMQLSGHTSIKAQSQQIEFFE